MRGFIFLRRFIGLTFEQTVDIMLPEDVYDL